MDAFVVRANGPLSGTVRVPGATKNAGLKQMAAALLAPGVTILRNVHPVLDLEAMLDVMRAIGADVEWTGTNELTIDATDPLTPEAPYEVVTRMRTSTIEIEGVQSLSAVDNEIMGDRIEAGTILMACGVAGGEVTVEGTRTEHLEMVVLKLGEMGLRVSPTPDGISARCDERLQAV